ncbi:MAG: A24 family peptidase [Lachnospiraceae bacterium]|nr:A24 family peptidase [Lachnospiraceae bacterium]MDD3794951.1 A24 family peptidase [Lachnospiraceae bacterium]
MILMQAILLLHLTGAAVLMDVKYTRIPNGLIVTGLLCGLANQIFTFGLAGLILYLSGIMLPVLLLGMFYYFRMIGAGDIKLLSAVGGFLGPCGCFYLIIYTILFGGVISALCILRRKNLVTRLVYFKTYFSTYVMTKKWQPYLNLEEKNSYFYFSIPVFLSTVCYLGGVY